MEKHRGKESAEKIRARKELRSRKRKHWEQGKANKVDAGQREKKLLRNSGEKRNTGKRAKDTTKTPKTHK